jgi:hypothetical protein
MPRQTKPRMKLTREQKAALEAYEFRLREEDRYFGSVFVDAIGTARVQAKTREAYERCKALGMTHEHGL